MILESDRTAEPGEKSLEEAKKVLGFKENLIQPVQMQS